MPDEIEQLHARLSAGQNLSGPDLAVARAFLEATGEALDDVGNSIGLGNLGESKRVLARSFDDGASPTPEERRRLTEIIEKYHAFRDA